MKSKHVLLLVLVGIFSPVILFASPTPQDINDNGILDSVEQNVVLTSDYVLPVGEYTFNNLTISNGATLLLEGFPMSPETFKGVKINAQNITIATGSKISTDAQGYSGYESPGTDTSSTAGASYGGLGGSFGLPKPIYGSATHPIDLGSGGPYIGRGGGAVQISVSGTLQNNGIISSNGIYSSSGGSILVNTDTLSGSGKFEANGGGISWSAVYYGQGGGGRIAIYFSNTTFSGVVEALGGCGSIGMGYPYTCAENGTAGLFDITNNNLRVGSSWRFEKKDSPVSYNNIVGFGSTIKSEDGVKITATNIQLDSNSSLTFGDAQNLKITNLFLTNNSQITFGKNSTTSVDSISLSTGSVLYGALLSRLELKLKNLSVDSTSSVNLDHMGYGKNSGPGAPLNEDYGLAGASYGGVGYFNTPSSTYGDENMPSDFGSGGNAFSYTAGGGALKLEVSENFVNNGVISANGRESSSGGSIFVTTNNLSGVGTFIAKGGTGYCPNNCFKPGGGGRIAVYYNTNNFSGNLDASGGGCSACYFGKGGDGTTILQKIVVNEQTGTSVVFFPGIMGSRLYDDMSGAEKEDWVSTVDSNHSKLTLDSAGKSINNIYTKDDTQSINDEAETGVIDEIYGQNIYNSFINDLRNWKTDGVVKDYAFIPYDWRLSLEDVITKGATTTNGKVNYNNNQNFSESYILKKLNELGTNSAHITLIGHSNGGLVIKALVQKLKETNNPLYYKIDKIIFVAVPQVGTPEAVATLLHGTSLGWGTVMYNQRSRGLSENMPSAYNLLPSTSYFGLVNPGFEVNKVVSFADFKGAYDQQISKYGYYISNQTELKDFVLGAEGRVKPAYNDTDKPNIGNSTLYSQAESVHSVLDYWQPASSTKVIQIAGWGEETTSGVKETTCLDTSIYGYRKCISPVKVVDGDGTVVVPSALWMSTTTPNVERWWVDLKTYNTLLKKKRIHRDILDINNISNLIESVLSNALYNDPDHVVVGNTSSLSSGDTRLHYILHSPLTLGVIDSQGRYTGLDPVTKQVKEEIPDVKYEVIGDTQFVSVPVSLVGHIKLSGLDNGVFALDVEKQIGNIVLDQTSFQGVPTTASTSVVMDVTSNISSSTMKLDENGDGLTDATLVGKSGSIVTLPKYVWKGFSQPINDTNFYIDQKLSVFKGGSTVPVKFQLQNSFGVMVQASSSPIWLTPQKGGSMSAAVDESVYNDNASSGTSFKWDQSSQQYIYNWNTKGLATGFWYKISVRLDDGNVYSVVVGLR